MLFRRSAFSFRAHVSSAHAERGVSAQELGQISRVVGRVRNRQRGTFGIDVDRRHVERQFRVRDSVKRNRTTAGHLDIQSSSELQRDPLGCTRPREDCGRSPSISSVAPDLPSSVSVNGIFNAPCAFDHVVLRPSISPLQRLPSRESRNRLPPPSRRPRFAL